MDSDGVGHVLWQDELSRFFYTQFDGTQWSAPEKTDLDRLFGTLPSDVPSNQTDVPLLYTGQNPLFVAGPGPYIFAFWISSESKLITSRVRNPNFGSVRAWEYGGVIANSVASFAVAVDALGEWHLTYVRSIDDPAAPAGIYYTRSRNNGGSWKIPAVPLYESPYLRTLSEGEANLTVTTLGTEDAQRVFVAWDNRPRKQVLLAQSLDGGASWEQPAVVAGPASDLGLAGPFNIRVGAVQEDVVLVWQSGQPGGTCSQMYQSSRDAGSTWSEPQPMIEDLMGCAQFGEFVSGFANNPERPMYFLTGTKSQSFLTLWNGHQWSQSQKQETLSGFEEPEIYSEVIYGCQQATWFGERMYVVGCDEGGGGDVWFTARDLASDISFSEAPVWSQLSPVTSQNLEMEVVELVTTDDGLIHAFLSQHRDRTIYYAYWNGEFWSGITPVFELPEGETAWPAIAARPENELFLIARNNVGALYFSRATSGNAARESRWAEPMRLGISFDGEIGSIDVAWDAAETVFMAYSIPVNAERGIYLVQSKDHGASWSEPLQVFNGEAAGFDVVGAPSLLITENGSLQIIWKQQSIQGDGDSQPISLYFTRSEDGGRTFSAAELVVDEPVAWQEIVTDGKGNLHLLWQSQENVTTVWDQISLDGGHSWQTPQGLPDVAMPAAVTVDSDGQLHLVHAGPGTLGHWLWDGTRWRSEVPLNWSSDTEEQDQPEMLAAAVNKEGKLVVVLGVPTGDGAEMKLLYSMHALELSPRQTVTKAVPTPTEVPPTIAPATPTIAPATPTPQLSSTQASTVESVQTNTQVQANSNETNGRTSPLMLALVPVALLLLGVLGIMIRRVTRGQDR